MLHVFQGSLLSAELLIKNGCNASNSIALNAACGNGHFKQCEVTG